MLESNDQILLLLDKISCDLTSDTLEEMDDQLETIRSIYEGFYSVYKDASFRHSYSIISRHLGSYDGEQRDSIPIGLQAVALYSRKVCDSPDATSEDKRIDSSINKLLDHIELECIRLNRMDMVQHYSDQAHDLAEQAKILNEETKNNAKEAQLKVTKNNEQSITFLGLFSAVIIGFLAELSLFVKGFENLTAENFQYVILYSCFVGMLTFDALFLLMYVTAKIAGTSFGVKCRYESCTECERHKYWFARAHCKYPYVIWFNIFCIVVSIVIYSSQIIWGHPLLYFRL